MKLKIIFSVFILLLISAVNVSAQIALPCSGDDPDAGCPLDTWVIALAVAVSFFAAIRLYRRKKLVL
jgi:hypothetical protein